MRKMASIRKITNITPIEGADAIETAWVGGWPSVIKKNEYKIGDLAVYLEIDSWVPHELASFLSKGKEPREYNGVKGERLRTAKLRGQLSQGLLLSINGCIEKMGCTSALEEGMDVTEWLNIQKWEAPIPACLAGQVDGVFPSWIRKTDEERIQNIVEEVFGYTETYSPLDITLDQAQEGLASGKLKLIDGVVNTVQPPKANPDAVYEMSVKLDGSSMTAFVRYSEEFEQIKTGVCSRNLMLKINDENKDNTFVKMFVESGLQEVMIDYHKETGRALAVQGELIGEGIQGNREGIKGHKLYIFNIFDIDNQRYLNPIERKALANMLAEKANAINKQDLINHVPVLYIGKLSDVGIIDVQSALKYAEGPSLNNPIREGIVFKRLDGAFSWKAISNLFLLKGGD